MPLRIVPAGSIRSATFSTLANDLTAGGTPSSARTSSTGDGVAAVNGRVSSK